jgi:hypothetical protein
MKKNLILWNILFISFGVQANDYYKCYNLEKNSSPTDVTMEISFSLFNNKINSVELIKRLKGHSFEPA